MPPGELWTWEPARRPAAQNQATAVDLLQGNDWGSGCTWIEEEGGGGGGVRGDSSSTILVTPVKSISRWLAVIKIQNVIQIVLWL